MEIDLRSPENQENIRMNTLDQSHEVPESQIQETSVTVQPELKKNKKSRKGKEEMDSNRIHEFGPRRYSSDGTLNERDEMWDWTVNWFEARDNKKLLRELPFVNVKRIPFQTQLSKHGLILLIYQS